jgi:hypothetical protein
VEYGLARSGAIEIRGVAVGELPEQGYLDAVCDFLADPSVEVCRCIFKKALHHGEHNDESGEKGRIGATVSQ